MLTQRWALRLSRPLRARRATNSIPAPTRRASHQDSRRRYVRDRSPNRPARGTANETPPAAANPIADELRQHATSSDSNLLAPVYIPEDPQSILKETHPATSILANSSVVVQRQLELMNVLLHFEQANKYVILDPQGQHIGFVAEQEHGAGRTFARQMLRTHRSFTTLVFDRHEKEVLRYHRPFSWINSRIYVYDGLTGNEARSSSDLSHVQSMRLIGEAQQQWAPLRRKYNLFLHRDLDTATTSSTSGHLPISTTPALTQQTPSDNGSMGLAQFAYIDTPFLSWDFPLLAADGTLLGSVSRNWRGWGREALTDTGLYAIRMDAACLSDAAGGNAEQPQQGRPTQQPESCALQPRSSAGLTLDQRAVALAAAVTVDFDYFSRIAAALAE